MERQTKAFNVYRQVLLLVVFSVLIVQLASLATLTSAEVAVRVTGRTLGDDGEALSEVAVIAYDANSNGLVANTSTNSEGVFDLYFHFYETPSGRFDLLFKKKGYVTNSQTVNVVWPEVNLGEIRLSKSLKLSAGVSGRTTTPGTSLELSFTLSNIGKEDIEECSLSIDYPPGWTANINDGNTPVTKARLLPGSAITLKLSAVVPSNASGENYLDLRIAGSAIVSWQIAIAISDEKSSFLTCPFPSKTGYPGGAVSYQVSIQNPLNTGLLLNLSTYAVPKSMQVAIRNSKQESVHEVQLQPKENIALNIDIEIGSDVVDGIHELILKATSAYLSEELLLKTVVKTDMDVIQIKSKYPSQVISQGATAKFPISVRNLGQTEEVFGLSADSIPSGWQVSFKTLDNVQITSVLIPADGVETLNVYVTSSLKSEPATYKIPIEVSSPRIDAAMNLEAIVSGSFGVSMDVSTIYLSTQAGSRQTLTVQAVNTGYSPLTNVEVETTYLTSGWSLEKSPLKVSVLESNSRAQFQIIIQSPEASAPSDYLVRVRMKSDQISSEEEVIRVTITSATTWGYAGIAMVIVALVAVVMIFRRVRRR